MKLNRKFFFTVLGLSLVSFSEAFAITCETARFGQEHSGACKYLGRNHAVTLVNGEGWTAQSFTCANGITYTYVYSPRECIAFVQHPMTSQPTIMHEGELLYVLNLQQLGELEFNPTDLPNDSFVSPNPIIQFGSGSLISLRDFPVMPIGSRTLTPIGSSTLPTFPIRRF